MPPDYSFENRARSRRAAAVLLSIWSALLLALWLIQLAPLLAGAGALLTLPLLWAFLTDARSTLQLTGTRLSWKSPLGADSLPLSMIRSARFDTRLDLSVKVTLQLTDGRRLRLPHGCVPPHRRFEEELAARGVPVERHHFSLIG